MLGLHGSIGTLDLLPHGCHDGHPGHPVRPLSPGETRFKNGRRESKGPAQVILWPRIEFPDTRFSRHRVPKPHAQRAVGDKQALGELPGSPTLGPCSLAPDWPPPPCLGHLGLSREGRPEQFDGQDGAKFRHNSRKIPPRPQLSEAVGRCEDMPRHSSPAMPIRELNSSISSAIFPDRTSLAQRNWGSRTPLG
ncbi:hypothetical protein CIHG_05023 [Coccidioides immitis H538.4]|uniref:Uncharacterized protein n=3 Tax=Coccidioides immitis TaxID=5501 RepID=A0A0J8QLW5_COCIT|nr:hypothetical protein CIRG_03955 [Coccidioides immitis RMSCC 2394]KMU73394.1 hypothetical protein CISG_03529 [Coccidioides immitis RMSCC 3703]KMU87083.1 hypothetical protein CIHG_05023 [Coccidioides immitis H538.4]